MLRTTVALLMLALATTTTGCAMCAAPDDYMGPTPADGLGFNERAGSILGPSGPSNMVFDQEVSQEAIGESVSEGVPAEAIPPQPVPAVDYIPQSRRAAPQSQWR
ncbi:MAG TPA: hypothetical protein VHD36_02260 [Pirellulales bacterium]|nr:hypothetical protein [Pirellulales bacterium]